MKLFSATKAFCFVFKFPLLQLGGTALKLHNIISFCLMKDQSRQHFSAEKHGKMLQKRFLALSFGPTAGSLGWSMFSITSISTPFAWVCFQKPDSSVSEGGDPAVCAEGYGRTCHFIRPRTSSRGLRQGFQCRRQRLC